MHPLCLPALLHQFSLVSPDQAASLPAALAQRWQAEYDEGSDKVRLLLLSGSTVAFLLGSRLFRGSADMNG